MNPHADDNTEARPPDTSVRPPSEGQKPSGDQPVVNVYTDADVERITAEKHSKLRTELAGYERQVAGMTTLQQQLEKANTDLADAKRERDREQFDKIKDDPDALKVWEQRKADGEERAKIKEERAQLEADKVTHSSLLTAAEKVSLLSKAQEIGKTHEVDPDLLTEQQTPEQMEALAVKLAKKYGGKVTPDIIPDSGVGSGAGVDFSKMTAEQKIQHAVAHPKKK